MQVVTRESWRERHAERAKERLEKMRTDSVAAAKGKGKAYNQIPTEGSYIREVYDLLKENAGYIIQFDDLGKQDNHRLPSIMEQLRNFYGCDIRNAGRQGKVETARSFILVGEWFGMKYVDYVAERAKKEDRDL